MLSDEDTTMVRSEGGGRGGGREEEEQVSEWHQPLLQQAATLLVCSLTSPVYTTHTNSIGIGVHNDFKPSLLQHTHTFTICLHTDLVC